MKEHIGNTHTHTHTHNATNFPNNFRTHCSKPDFMTQTLPCHHHPFSIYIKSVSQSVSQPAFVRLMILSTTAARDRPPILSPSPMF